MRSANQKWVGSEHRTVPCAGSPREQLSKKTGCTALLSYAFACRPTARSRSGFCCQVLVGVQSALWEMHWGWDGMGPTSASSLQETDVGGAVPKAALPAGPQSAGICLAVLLLAQDIAWLCNVQLKGWLSP